MVTVSEELGRRVGMGVPRGRVVRYWSASLEGRMWYWRRERGSGPEWRKAASEGTKMVAAEGRWRAAEARWRVRAMERKPESARVCAAAVKRGSGDDAWAVVVGEKKMRVRRRSKRVWVSSMGKGVCDELGIGNEGLFILWF